MGQVPTSIPSEGLTTGDLFLGRPHAPDRSDRQAERPIPPRLGHGLNLSTMNTLSLGNWLTSLPDTNSGRKDEFEEGRDSKKPEPRKISEVELAELDDLDTGGCIERPSSGIRPRIQAGSPMSLETARHLKLIMFGEPGEQNHKFSPGWIGQAFMFSTHRDLSFGLVQHKGGPCGVLAAVQARLVKVLLFGSKIFAISKALAPLRPTPAERTTALAAALGEILSLCSPSTSFIVALPSMTRHLSSAGRFRTDGVTETLVTHSLNSPTALLSFLKDNIGFFSGSGNSAVIAFTYAAILTRGLDTVKNDMDTEKSTIMGAHGYCSQEVVNLMLTGQATSNVFDNNIDLSSGEDQTILKGIHKTCDIGLLSLFEHYQSCRVGDRLKNPAYPIWVVCSESHFTVLFSEELDLTSAFLELHYYDGLARQDAPIRLTVHPGQEGRGGGPLELTIRTKWAGANIDWNGSEPIL